MNDVEAAHHEVEAAHHEVARRIVELLHDLDDLDVLVGVQDAVAGCLFVRDFFDEERGVGAIFSLVVGDIGGVTAEHIIVVHQYKIAVDVWFGLGDSVGQAELLALVRVRDWHGKILVAVAIDNLFGLVADDDEFCRPSVDQVVKNIFDGVRAVDFDEDLRLVVGEQSKARGLTGGK